IATQIATYFALNKGTLKSRANEWDAHKVVVRGISMSMSKGVRQTLTNEIRMHEQNVRAAECKFAEGAIDNAGLTAMRTLWKDADHRLRQYDYKYHMARRHSEGDRPGRLL
ncbi:hypothetical protein NDU88_003703, partial [Pleurodeles waltl]